MVKYWNDQCSHGCHSRLSLVFASLGRSHVLRGLVLLCGTFQLSVAYVLAELISLAKNRAIVTLGGTHAVYYSDDRLSEQMGL